MTSSCDDTPWLLTVPAEIILRILEYLDIPTLLTCLQVCRRFHDIVANSITLQYNITLLAHGMHDNTQEDEELAWTNHETIDLQDLWKPYVSDGYLVFQAKERDAPVHGPTRLVVFQLPSALRGIQARRWTLDFDFSASFYIVDVARDLLVISCAESHNHQDLRPHLHLQCLSTGDQHTLSQTDGIIRLPEHRVPFGNFIEFCRIQGDHLALVAASEQETSLVVWNWHSGIVIAELVLPQPFYGYSFLDDLHLVVAALLHVYSLERCARNPGILLTPWLEATYKLPDNEILRGIIRKPHFLCESPGQSLPIGHFYPDTTMETTALSLILEVFQDSGWGEFDLHIPSAVLLSHTRPPLQTKLDSSIASTNVSAWSGTPAPVIMPWNQWGQAVICDIRTLSLSVSTPPRPSLIGLPSTFGARTSFGRNALVLADYHPRRVARALAREDLHLKQGRTLVGGNDNEDGVVKHERAYIRAEAVSLT
ncbi:hypothetical protein B0F90DRAFT_1773117 [Multifurca ochricompacta]|uniref:F-box domain-containing protein n=1 Tax=Multifurca ochricompacta TaxID=376703 RepID=A0AAD4LWC6_9AGAM|nr:hypothetical protein B0F90DRAFT_1773117 [Multifurca ochricompacta]